MPQLAGDGGLQLFGREDRERGLGDPGWPPRPEMPAAAGRGRSTEDVDGGLSIVIAEDGRRTARSLACLAPAEAPTTSVCGRTSGLVFDSGEGGPGRRPWKKLVKAVPLDLLEIRECGLRARRPCSVRRLMGFAPAGTKTQPGTSDESGRNTRCAHGSSSSKAAIACCRAAGTSLPIERGETRPVGRTVGRSCLGRSGLASASSCLNRLTREDRPSPITAWRRPSRAAAWSEDSAGGAGATRSGRRRRL